MDPFAMYGKVLAQAGRRDAVVGHLLEASRILSSFPGCELYIVNVASSDPDTIWVTELWRSEQDHDASLKLESIKALIALVQPLVAGFEAIRLSPVGGKGMPSA